MTSPHELHVSLVIPVKNESRSLAGLIDSVRSQTLQPGEVVLVDGGSSDETIEIAEQAAAYDPRIRLVKTSGATPGRGRNIGVENARFEWIAFTDAGIRVKENWLEKLVEKVANDPSVDIVYGNYSPVISNSFEKIATFTYVPAQRPGSIRGITIASYLMRKKVWSEVGGFPDLRAAEDLMFMERAERCGFRTAVAPEAVVYWQLRPDLPSTFRKFVLYSKHNVWAGRQWDWHYGIARQYLVVLPFLILAVIHSWWWLALAALWLLARTTKRILLHRFEFGLLPLFNPFIFSGVMFLILIVDLATFAGWVQAILGGKR